MSEAKRPMNFSNFLKANVLGGVFGTLVLSPLAYMYELVREGAQSTFRDFGAMDLIMLFVVPVLVGFAFAITAVAAYPLVVLLERKGYISFAEQ